MTAAVVYQMDTNKIGSLRCRMVIRMLNTTMLKLMTTIMSTGHGNSAYSRPWVCPGGNSDDTGGDGNIPEYRAEHAEFVAEDFGSQQFREIIKGGRQQTGCHKSEQNGVDVHRSHPSEMDVFNIGQKVRCNQIARSQSSRSLSPPQTKMPMSG